MIRYLTVPHVITIHDRILPCPVRDISALGAAVDKPRAGWGPTELYETIPEKGAALLQGLAMNHPFIDGNKRTAWTSTQVFLTANRSPMDKVDDMEGVDFVVRLIEQRLDVREIAEWLAYRFHA